MFMSFGSKVNVRRNESPSMTNVPGITPPIGQARLSMDAFA